MSREKLDLMMNVEGGVGKVFQVVKNREPLLGLLMLTVFHTGMTWREAAVLDIDDFDEKTGCLSIERKLSGKGRDRTIDFLSKNKRREVYLTGSLMELFVDVKEYLNNVDGCFFFPSLDKKMPFYSSELKKISKECGVPEFSLSSLKDCFSYVG